jgi:hypothetical protein
MKKNNCPLCKNPMEYLVVTHNLESSYEELIGNKAMLIPDSEDSKVFYDSKDTGEALDKLRGYYCPMKDCQKNLHEFKALDSHLRNTHNRTFCEICFKHRLVFIGEQLIFPTHKLKEHMRYGTKYIYYRNNNK